MSADVTATAQEAADGSRLPAALAVSDLGKTFGGTRALAGVSLQVEAGEVHALVGENGSGKSTLIKILAGYHLADPGGLVEVGGVPLEPGSAQAAYAAGARFVHQDLGLVDELSIPDNLALTAGFPTRLGTVQRGRARQLARESLERVGVDVDIRRPVGELAPADRTGVAIARALQQDPDAPVRLVIFDEPTATMPENDVQRLLQIVRTVSQRGIGVLYVTHRLDEVFQIASRVTVLRDGYVAASEPTAGVTRSNLIHWLVGSKYDELTTGHPATVRSAGAVSLDVRDMSAGRMRQVSVAVRKNEIVGLAGITGSGRDDFCSAVFGALPSRAGEVWISGAPVRPDRPRTMIAVGVGYIPGDRKRLGGFMQLTARENVSITDLSSYWSGGWLSRKGERDEVAHWFDALDVRPRGAAERPLNAFSGGNQQKLMVARWLRREPKVLLLDEPTQGVDIAAKATLHQQIRELAARGTAVIVASTDNEELAELCHRVLVLRDGKVATVLEGAEITAKRVTHECIGETTEEPSAHNPVA